MGFAFGVVVVAVDTHQGFKRFSAGQMFGDRLLEPSHHHFTVVQRILLCPLQITPVGRKFRRPFNKIRKIRVR